MSKEKCRYYKACYRAGKKPEDKSYPCPKNTNENCELVPPKKKLVRVKAIAYIDWDSGCYTISAVNVKPKFFGSVYHAPCTILIEEEYLKEMKK